MKIRIRRDNATNKTGYVTKLLDKHLVQSQYQYPRKHVIRPSEIASCIRKQVCSILQFPYEDTITPRQQRIFDMGNYVHSRYLRRYIPRLGIASRITVFDRGVWKVKDFIEISIQAPLYWLKGSPDAVIIHDEDGLPYVFELKSIKQELFELLIRPDWNYTAQVQMYMFMTGVTKAIVFYENKNTQETKEFVIERDDTVISQLLNKAQRIQDYVLDFEEKRTLPDCECGKWNDCMKFQIPEGVK